MTSRDALILKNVTFSYDGLTVLEDVNLTVSEGELLCIVGPNGGGKTTLLKLMLGILVPQRGSIQILGTTPERARPRVSYMAQYVHYDPQFPVTVLDIVLMGRLGTGISGFYSKADKRKALEALDEVGLSGADRRLFSLLSGGQKQRVFIARALASQPSLLLLDEPTASVDVAVEAQFFEVLQRLSKTMTILIVSHDLGFVSSIVQSVVCVNRKVVVHPTSELNGTLIRDLYRDRGSEFHS
ncbi:MAG TPA: ABC transporter ATP-binding protein, partial [bacterium]|nr:ABC transporter ATP-binding protein [bacterium]